MGVVVLLETRGGGGRPAKTTGRSQVRSLGGRTAIHSSGQRQHPSTTGAAEQTIQHGRQRTTDKSQLPARLLHVLQILVVK